MISVVASSRFLVACISGCWNSRPGIHSGLGGSSTKCLVFSEPIAFGSLPPAPEETVVKKTGSTDEKAALFFLFEKTR